MSALWAPISGWLEDAGSPVGRRDRLRPLRTADQAGGRLARFPFLLVLIGIFGVGMAGLLMLNTTLQNQAFVSRALNRQATELTYAQADLENSLDAVSAPQELARRASALGMRPNPAPAFVRLPGGKVIGHPQPVTGGELPGLIVKTPAQLQAEADAARARAEAKAAAAQAAAEKKAAEQQAAAEREAAAQKKKKAEQRKSSGRAGEQGGR